MAYRLERAALLVFGTDGGRRKSIPMLTPLIALEDFAQGLTFNLTFEITWDLLLIFGAAIARAGAKYIANRPLTYPNTRNV